MLYYFGIDEAGYGPMLGPLCVATSGFAVQEASSPDPCEELPDLWQQLSKAVCRSRRDQQRRIAIDDSKKLKGARTSKTHPLTHLERGVLSFAASRRHLPRTDTSLFDQLSANVNHHPWYERELQLPLGQDAGLLNIAANKLTRVLEQSQVEYLGSACEIIDAETFNKQVEVTGRKSTVNFAAAMRLVDRIWRQWPSAQIVLDRQGGRVHYRDDLQHCWPDACITVFKESPKESRYGLKTDLGSLKISFEVAAEDRHLPVALASMTAKYTRELLMQRLNGFFGDLVPKLKPTAGYVQDARRYLAEIGSCLEEQSIDREQLVRSC